MAAPCLVPHGLEGSDDVALWPEHEEPSRKGHLMGNGPQSFSSKKLGACSISEAQAWVSSRLVRVGALQA